VSVEPRELRCNACGAALHYEPGTAVITCAHCGTEYALEAPAEGVIEFTIEEAEEDVPAVTRSPEPERPAYEEEVLTWLREGKKVQAIKVVRAHTGMGLRECKEYVEGLAVREGITSAPRSAAYATFVVAALIAVATLGVVIFLLLAR
jgi:LSD1 subclass zinc finger protein